MSESKEDQMTKWIDNASYEELLRKWRFAAVGDLFFQGDVGAYYTKVMAEKKAQLDDNGVSASKRIRWYGRRL